MRSAISCPLARHGIQPLSPASPQGLFLLGKLPEEEGSAGKGSVGSLLLLVELASQEDAALVEDRGPELGHAGRPNASLPHDQEQLRELRGHHPLEGGAQLLELGLSKLDQLRCSQLSGRVAGAEGERLDSLVRGPLLAAVPEVDEQPLRCG